MQESAFLLSRSAYCKRFRTGGPTRGHADGAVNRSGLGRREVHNQIAERQQQRRNLAVHRAGLRAAWYGREVAAGRPSQDRHVDVLKVPDLHDLTGTRRAYGLRSELHARRTETGIEV